MEWIQQLFKFPAADPVVSQNIMPDLELTKIPGAYAWNINFSSTWGKEGGGGLPFLWAYSVSLLWGLLYFAFTLSLQGRIFVFFFCLHCCGHHPSSQRTHSSGQISTVLFIIPLALRNTQKRSIWGSSDKMRIELIGLKGLRATWGGNGDL